MSAETRRYVAKGSAAAAVTATLAAAIHAGENNTLKVALVGCGGRGTGAAANALQTAGPTRLWALADVFPHRLEATLNALSGQFPKQVDVPPARRFLGLDAYRKAIDSLDGADVVLLATPPAFRPIHFEYAVSRGRNVFMEKSFAVDAPGVRRVLRAGEEAARKNVKVAGGLMWRHDPPREECVRRIHDGAIGDVVFLRTYRLHGPVGSFPKPPGTGELAYQISNYCNFPWLNGSFFVDWLIHNIDVCCWAKNARPVAAQGMGGRMTRTEPGAMYDYYSVEYLFEDGARLLAQGRHIADCYDIFSDLAHGTKGSALIMENLAAPKPRLYRSQVQTRPNEVWRYDGPPCDPFQREFDLFFEAIRQDRTYNEAERSAHAAMVAILGRMAAESGKMIRYQDALASKVELAPGLEKFTLDSPAPIQPDAQGQYPLPWPGRARVL